MSRRTESAETGGEHRRLPAGVVLKPAVTAEELKKDTEYDPDGAEEFVAMIRALRNEDPHAVKF